ncbi:dynein heavy chain [Babesia ovis]|uniref:Dynein heavy chain n=1 Tax=Babesia ovis TaxID=5869 RepID=A0A9W5TA93_BABOV|nr:dynein heavy chain [Babesia ovis]
MAASSDDYGSYDQEANPGDASMHTEEDCALKTGDVGHFRTIFDANGTHVSCDEDEESSGNWLKRKIDKGISMNSSLPMYKSYIEQQIISKDRKNQHARPTGRRLNKRVRRFLTVIFCITVAVLTYLGSTRVINWAEDRRKADADNTTLQYDEIMRLKQTVESLRLELTKVKETAYTNSVAINGITNGAFKLPGSDDAAPKKAKFGKNKPSINQGAVPQNFDTKQFAYPLDAQAKGMVAEVDLNPIIHEADIH